MKKSTLLWLFLMVGISQYALDSHAMKIKPDQNSFNFSEEEKTYSLKDPKLIVSKSEDNDASLNINNTHGNNPCNNSIKNIDVSLVKPLYNQIKDVLEKNKNDLLPTDVNPSDFDILPVKLYLDAKDRSTVSITDLKNTTMSKLIDTYDYFDSAQILISVTIKKNNNFSKKQESSFEQATCQIIFEQKINQNVKILTEEEQRKKRKDDHAALEKIIRKFSKELDEHYDYDVSISSYVRNLLDMKSLEKILKNIDVVKKDFINKNKNALAFVNARSIIEEKLKPMIENDECEDIHFKRLNDYLKRLINNEEKSAEYIVNNSDDILIDIIKYEQKLQTPYKEIESSYKKIKEAEENGILKDLLTKEFLSKLNKTTLQLKQYWDSYTQTRAHNSIYHPRFAHDHDSLEENLGESKVVSICQNLKRMNSTEMNQFVNDLFESKTCHGCN
jgi:hypothetical protein